MKVLFRAVVAMIYLFLLAPLVFVVVSSLGRQAILAFPPDSISFAWYGEISPQLLAFALGQSSGRSRGDGDFRRSGHLDRTGGRAKPRRFPDAL